MSNMDKIKEYLKILIAEDDLTKILTSGIYKFTTMNVYYVDYIEFLDTITYSKDKQKITNTSIGTYFKFNTSNYGINTFLKRILEHIELYSINKTHISDLEEIINVFVYVLNMEYENE